MKIRNMKFSVNQREIRFHFFWNSSNFLELRMTEENKYLC